MKKSEIFSRVLMIFQVSFALICTNCRPQCKLEISWSEGITKKWRFADDFDFMSSEQAKNDEIISRTIFNEMKSSIDCLVKWKKKIWKFNDRNKGEWSFRKFMDFNSDSLKYNKRKFYLKWMKQYKKSEIIIATMKINWNK